MKKTQRQSKFSVSQPPSSGPRIGPTMIPAPQIAIAWPTFSRGLMSSSTACDSGTSAAPNTPCSSRAATISTSEFASPQSAEAIVEADHRDHEDLAPSPVAAQPAGQRQRDRRGHDVGGQDPGDLVLRGLQAALHVGSATLAMVVSSACMMVASMIETVISPRWATPSSGGLIAAPRSAATADPRGPCEQGDQLGPFGRRELRQRARLQAVAEAERGVERLFSAWPPRGPGARAGRSGCPGDGSSRPPRAGRTGCRPPSALQVQPLRQLDLRHRRLVAMHRQRAEHPALGPRQADAFARQPVELLAVELGDIVHEEAEALAEVSFHKGTYYKYA